MIRTPLKALSLGKYDIVRLSTYKATIGRSSVGKYVLLTNIVYTMGNSLFPITCFIDHLWVDKSEFPDVLQLGDTIEFDASVYYYLFNGGYNYGLTGFIFRSVSFGRYHRPLPKQYVWQRKLFELYYFCRYCQESANYCYFKPHGNCMGIYCSVYPKKYLIELLYRIILCIRIMSGEIVHLSWICY